MREDGNIKSVENTIRSLIAQISSNPANFAAYSSELQGLLNTVGIDPNLIAAANQVLMEAGEKYRSSVSADVYATEVKGTLSAQLRDFTAELEEEKQTIAAISKEIAQCIAEIQELRKKWLEDPFSAAGVAARSAMMDKMVEGIEHLDSLAKIIAEREKEIEQIKAILKGTDAHVHSDIEPLNQKLAIAEAHLIGSKEAYERNINAHAKEVWEAVTAEAILKSNMGKILKTEIDVKMEKASSKGPTEEELKPIKEYLHQHSELAEGKGKDHFERFTSNLVDEKVKELQRSGAQAPEVKREGKWATAVGKGEDRQKTYAEGVEARRAQTTDEPGQAR